MAKYTFLDLASEVLGGSERPLTAQEIWDSAETSGITKKLNSTGKTPHVSLAAQLYTNVKKPDSAFMKVGEWPTRFMLVTSADKMPKQQLEAFEMEVTADAVSSKYLEKDLHPLLVWFAANQWDAACKTIKHTKSEKKGNKANEWLHPDIVGFSLETAGWPQETVGLFRETESIPVRLFSFELKLSLSYSNLRESFFQAVSNSSWGHEGYLAATSINDDPQFRAELQRLSESFGIGVIELIAESPDETHVLFPARSHARLDWAMLNRLTGNPDFRDFLKVVTNSVKINMLVEQGFDPIPDTLDLDRKFGNVPKV